MKKVVIVGVGALGSHVVQALRNVEATIVVVDFDRVEARNTMSQFHPKNSVGRSKVVGLQQTMQFLWGQKLTVIPHKLSADNVSSLLLETDLVLDCLDNGASRRVVQHYALRTKTPCLHGALAADGSFGRVMWSENFKIDDEPGVGVPTCENGVHLPFIMMVSSYVAYATQKYLEHGQKMSYYVHPAGAVSV